LSLLDPLRGVPDVGWGASITVSDSNVVFDTDAVHHDMVLPTASIGKVLLLVAILDGIERRTIDRDEMLTVEPGDAVADSGLLQHLEQQRLSVIDLCRFVGALSDNLATNVLIRRVGLEQVTAVTRALGVERSALHDVVRDVRVPGQPPHLSTGTAGEWDVLMRRVHTGAAISPHVSAGVVDLLSLGTDLSMVAGGFALDPLAHRTDDVGVRLFNKTGTQRGTRADVGCVVAGARVATYAVIAHFDDSFWLRSTVLGAMRDVGRAIRTSVVG
jgi:beta-lactamase class A